MGTERSKKVTKEYGDESTVQIVRAPFIALQCSSYGRYAPGESTLKNETGSSAENNDTHILQSVCSRRHMSLLVSELLMFKGSAILLYERKFLRNTGLSTGVMSGVQLSEN